MKKTVFWIESIHPKRKASDLGLFCEGSVVLQPSFQLRRYRVFYSVEGYVNELINHPFFNRIIEREEDRWQASRMAIEWREIQWAL